MSRPEFVYVLDVRVEITKRYANGGCTGERLSVSEEMELPPTSFLEAAQILGRFNALAEKVRGEASSHG